MYCENCGKEIPDRALHCRYCGAKQESMLDDVDAVSPSSSAPVSPPVVTADGEQPPEPFPSSPSGLQDAVPSTSDLAMTGVESDQPLHKQGASRKRSKKATKAWMIAASIVIVLVTVVVLYFVLRPNYVDKMMDALREGDNVKAVDIYREHVSGHEKRELQAQDEYRSWLAVIQDEFDQELITYEEAQSRFAVAKLIALDSAAYETVEEHVTSLQRARETIKAAADSLSQGDFLSAMTNYGEVLKEGQFLQDEAAKGLESSTDKYRTYMVDAIEEQMEAGKHEQAQALLLEGLSNLPEDKLLSETKSQLQAVWSKAISDEFQRSFAAGDHKQAGIRLLEGLKLFPDDEILQKHLDELVASRDYKVYAPWEIVTIFDGELIDSDGTCLGDVKLSRPVFQPDYEHADKLNAAFAALIFNPQLGALTEPATAETVKEFFSEEVEAVREMLKQGDTDSASFYSQEEWKQSYRKGSIISFKGLSEIMRGGAPRPSHAAYGRTFDLKTGEVLQLMDFLLISPEQQVETIYKEYVAYLKKRGGEGSRLLDDPELVAEAKRQCGEDVVFWMEEDGIHVYFDYGWAEGDAELLLPYSREDLFQPSFVVKSDEWKKAYVKQLQSKAKSIKSWYNWQYEGPSRKNVAIVDICGDDTPELLYITHDQEKDSCFKLYVWGYDNGLVPLLKGAEAGTPYGGGAYAGVAGLKGGKLLIRYDVTSDYWDMYDNIYEYKNGKLTLTEALFFTEYPDYNNPERAITEYFYNKKKINEKKYESLRSARMSEIKSPIFAITDYVSYEGLKKFVGKNAMTYKEAIAFLTK
ncbi:MAG TPA: zinc ribbon domain-containing protein [Clostridiaceae bacterium]|nr:zinc ribbon domain-containing protein [Clostridiaceae bacterium]